MPPGLRARVLHAIDTVRAFLPQGLSLARRLLVFLAAFSPAFVTACLVWAHSVNTPVWDDWERGPLLQKFYSGTLTFADLYAPHIDHRIFFPRLIILALNELSGGNLRWEMAASWLMAFAAGLGVWQLARRTVFGEATSWGAVFATNLIIFSPIQWDNWVWGVQIAFLMPMTFTVWALVITQMPWRWWVRLLACGVCAIIGTHSFGHGFAVWPAVLGVSLLSHRFADSQRDRFLFAGCWAVLATAVICCYALVKFENSSDMTHSYGQGPGAPPPSVINKGQILAMPLHAATFVATLAGNPFARFHLVDPLDLAPRIGCVLIVFFFGMALHRLRRVRREPGRWDDAIPWLALGGAALAGMIAVAIGRLNFAGLTRAASIRYVSISQYLAVAVLMLGVLWWRVGRWRAEPRFQLLGPVTLAVFCGLMIPAWIYGAGMMRLCEEARYQGHASLVFINFLEPEVAWRIDAGAEFPRKQAAFLNEKGLLHPPLAKSLNLADFKPLHRDRPYQQAAIRSFDRGKKPDTYVVSGHASVDGRPADLVLMTWETDDIPPQIFAAGEPTTDMVQQVYPNDLELVGRLKPGRHDHLMWEKEIRHEDMGFMAFPEVNGVTIRFWVYDVQRNRAYRIKGAWQVTRSGDFKVLDPPGVPAAPQRHVRDLSTGDGA